MPLIIADRVRPMRIAAVPDGPVERLGLLLNKLPTPIGEAMFAMPVARCLQAAQRTGMLAALAEGPREPGELAEHLGLQKAGTARVLDVIASLGHVRQLPDGRYEMTKSGRPWLDPRSDTYLGDFLADTAEYWDWYARLEDLVRDGTHAELHGKGARRPLLAVLHPRPVPAGAPLQCRSGEGDPARPRRHPVLDVAGAHGETRWRSAAARGSAGDDRRPARQRQGGGADRRRGGDERPRPPPRRRHVRGRLRGPLRRRDELQHHPSPLAGANPDALPRIRAVLHPGAPFAVLDLYDRPGGQRPTPPSILGLFFHLTSGADTYTVEEVSRWMGESGFGSADVKSFRTLPDLRLLIAKAV